MRKILKLKTIVSLFLALFVIVMINSCKKDEEKDDPPELPPVGSLLMDFSDFDDPADTISKHKAIETYQNWGHSFVTVAFWNILATVSMGMPALAFAEAVNHQPVYLGVNSWEWSYEITVGPVVYTIKLVTNRVSNEEYIMKMLVSKSGTQGFDDFKWFEGTVRYDQTSAYWILYENPSNPNELLDIDWTMDWEAGTYTIKYTYIKPGTIENGSYIKHGVTGESPYDAYYTVSVSMNTVEIEWNKTTKAGRVKDPFKFGDTDWHCWDENLMDTVCL